MKYCKKINLKCEKLIRDYLLELVLVPTVIHDQIKIPHRLPQELLKTINDELASYGIPELLYCQSYIRAKGTTQGVHVDGVDFLWHAAINLPIENTKNTKFRWYDGEYNIERKTQDTGAISGMAPITFFEIVDIKELVAVETIELDQAYLVRVDKPHHAESNSDGYRWVFTMRFKGNPTFEELYDKLPS